jgi:hypothetical protein
MMSAQSAKLSAAEVEEQHARFKLLTTAIRNKPAFRDIRTRCSIRRPFICVETCTQPHLETDGHLPPLNTSCWLASLRFALRLRLAYPQLTEYSTIASDYFAAPSFLRWIVYLRHAYCNEESCCMGCGRLPLNGCRQFVTLHHAGEQSED